MKKYTRITFFIVLALTFAAVPARAAFLTLLQTVGASPDPAYSVGLALDPSEQHLYVTRSMISSNSNLHAVEIYRRDKATGQLTFLGAELDYINGPGGLDSPEAIVVSPDGKHVYVSTLDEFGIVIYRRNSDGSLGLVDKLVGNIATRVMAFSPNGQRLYVADSFANNALRVYDRNPTTGLLTLLQTLTDDTTGVDGLNVPTGITVSPDGAHVYVASRDDNTVAFFRQIGGQLLEFVGTQSSNLIGLAGARDVVISPDGQHLYVHGFTDADKGAIAIFQRNPTTGQLTYLDFVRDGINGVQLPGPRPAAISPNGKQLYVGLSVFERNLTSGLLTFVERQEANATPLDGVVSGDSRDVYFSNALGKWRPGPVLHHPDAQRGPGLLNRHHPPAASM